MLDFLNNIKLIAVDDDNLIRFVLEDLLEDHFNIDLFDKPEKALEFLKENGDNVYGVITDFSMPNINGLEFMTSVSKIKPNIKAIMLTGNPQNDPNLMVDISQSSMFTSFLTKPFKFEDRFDEFKHIIYKTFEASYFLDNNKDNLISKIIEAALFDKSDLESLRKACKDSDPLSPTKYNDIIILNNILFFEGFKLRYLITKSTDSFTCTNKSPGLDQAPQKFKKITDLNDYLLKAGI